MIARMVRTSFLAIDWILPEARVGLTKPELRSFFLRGLTPSSWLVAGTYFTDGSKLHPDPHRREVGWGFCAVPADLQLRTGAHGQSHLKMLLHQWLNSLHSSSWLKGPSLWRGNFALGAACLRLSSCRTAVFSSAWTGFCAQRLAPVCMASMSDSKKLQKCVVFLFLVFNLFFYSLFFFFFFPLRFSSIVPTPLCRDLLS